MLDPSESHSHRPDLPVNVNKNKEKDNSRDLYCGIPKEKKHVRGSLKH